MSAGVDYAQARAELESVVASGLFAKAPSLGQLLNYVCTKYFDGQSDQIKEYNIAVEALGRPSAFDQRKDSIVRVEAFRLRKRLKDFYEHEGAHHAIKIVIPPGQYVPQFVKNEKPELVAEPPELAPEEEFSVVRVPPMALSEGAILPGEPVAAMRNPAGPLIAMVLLALGLAAGFLFSRPPASTTISVEPLPAAPSADEIRIMAGSSLPRHVDRLGNVWGPDRFFHGGSVFPTPNHSIAGTPDQELFHNRREGEFSYDIPLKPGIYELHLYFAETLFGDNNTAGGGESSRVFQVVINGQPKLWAFDVLSDAGGSNTADEKIFKDISPAGGILHLRFASLVNNVPFVNALEIVPGIRGKMRPIRIVAGPRNYTDRNGRVWGADRFYRRGFAVTRSELVGNTSDPDLFRAERFGNFEYSIPVATGRYGVTLKFAETWFGPGQPGSGGAGSRIFDLYSNGQALIRNFDLFRAAGGSNRAFEKTFHGITPNAQGKIELSFVPVENYGCVNAIEVVDESN